MAMIVGNQKVDKEYIQKMKEEYDQKAKIYKEKKQQEENTFEDLDDEESILTDLCGDFIKDASNEIYSYIQASPTTVLNIILVMMSTVIGSRAVTYNLGMREVRLNLWTIILGATAVTAKSSTAEIVYDLVLGNLQMMLNNMYQEEKEQYIKLEVKEQANVPEPKHCKIKVGQSSTFQGVLLALSKNPNGLLYYADEALSILEKMNKSSELKADLTSVYSEKEFTKTKVGSSGTGEDIIITRPFLSIVMLSTPTWFYSNLKKDSYISGYLARFTIFEIDEPVKRIGNNRKKQDFSKFQAISEKIWKYFNNFSNTQPLEVELTDEAFDRYEKWDEENYFYDEEDAYDESFEEDSYNGALARIKNKAFKYALIIQIFDTFYKGEVFDETDKVSLKYINIGLKIADNDIINMRKSLATFEHKSTSLYIQTGEELEKQKDAAALKMKDFLLRKQFSSSTEATTESNVIKNNTFLKRARTHAYGVFEIAINKYGVESFVEEYRGRDVTKYYCSKEKRTYTKNNYKETISNFEQFEQDRYEKIQEERQEKLMNPDYDD